MDRMDLLAGRRFGKLTALERAERSGVKTTWRCRCDCGKIIAVRTVHLRSGHTQFCGCLYFKAARAQHDRTTAVFEAKKQERLKRLDLTGQVFGKLTVLEQSENKGARTAWRCRCDCGRIVTVVTTSLRSGNTKSCGCVRSRPSNPSRTQSGHSKPAKVPKPPSDHRAAPQPAPVALGSGPLHLMNIAVIERDGMLGLAIMEELSLRGVIALDLARALALADDLVLAARRHQARMREARVHRVGAVAVRQRPLAVDGAVIVVGADGRLV
jgi:hypothetical protein